MPLTRVVPVSLVLLFAGACGPTKPECSPDTCAGCCDATGACLGGGFAGACGILGSACAACGPGTNCQAGLCVANNFGSGGGSGTTGGGVGTGGGSSATGGGSGVTGGATGGGSASCAACTTGCLLRHRLPERHHQRRVWKQRLGVRGVRRWPAVHRRAVRRHLVRRLRGHHRRVPRRHVDQRVRERR